jgi:hypothetical protein
MQTRAQAFKHVSFARVSAVLMLMVLSSLFTYIVIVNLQGPAGTLPVGFHYTVEVWVRKAGTDEWKFLMKTHNVFTKIGKNWVRDALGNAPPSDVAKYISLSAGNGTAPADTWVQLPSELTGGLARAAGTYGALGVGTWEIEYTFTSDVTVTVVDTGLHWASSGSGNMIAAAELSPTASLASGDSLKITWSNNVS